MSIWQRLYATGVNPVVLSWAALTFVLASLILYMFRPAERKRIRSANLLFVFSLVSFAACIVLVSLGGSPTGLANRWLTVAAELFLALAFVNIASIFVFDVLLDALRLRPPRILLDLLLALAYIVVAIAILSRQGRVDISGIVATSAVITAVIGLSFQDTLGNMMGGMALQMERTIAVGDWIKVDGQEGLVKEIRWRHTSIETRNWDTVVIPNSALMKSQVTLLGRRTGQPRQHRQWVYFNVDFRYSPSEVIDIVQSALRAEPIANVAAEPPPNCVLMDFKESYCSYAVRYWLTDLAVDDPTNSVVRTRLYFALRRAEIPLSIPAHSLFVTEEDQSRHEQKTSDEINKRIDMLKNVELFHALTDKERRALAPRLRVAPFVRGEAITRQGAEAHWLYLITHGDAEVRVSVDGKLSEHLATLHQGDFFGEMGMMTGEPRTATVIAVS
ncbi:MAG TPA: mechanosensitive ion channel family protein, partial [Terriglobales bacterium]|nr:mechanosensitive ion channel family protein [Terriglobales bacterium]